MVGEIADATITWWVWLISGFWCNGKSMSLSSSFSSEDESSVSGSGTDSGDLEHSIVKSINKPRAQRFFYQFFSPNIKKSRKFEFQIQKNGLKLHKYIFPIEILECVASFFREKKIDWSFEKSLYLLFKFHANGIVDSANHIVNSFPHENQRNFRLRGNFNENLWFMGTQ